MVGVITVVGIAIMALSTLVGVALVITIGIWSCVGGVVDGAQESNKRVNNRSKMKSVRNDETVIATLYVRGYTLQAVPRQIYKIFAGIDFPLT